MSLFDLFLLACVALFQKEGTKRWENKGGSRKAQIEEVPLRIEVCGREYVTNDREREREGGGG